MFFLILKLNLVLVRELKAVRKLSMLLQEPHFTDQGMYVSELTVYMGGTQELGMI